MRNALPVVLTLVVLVLLMYPLALLFGIPLARRDMEDSRKWLREAATVQPAPVIPADGLSLPEAIASSFGTEAAGVPVMDGTALAPDETAGWVDWLGEMLPEGDSVWTLAQPLPDSFEAYVNEGGDWRHLERGSVPPALPPDGNRVRFTFGGAEGPVLLDGVFLREGEHFELEGAAVTFLEPPPFGSQLLRIEAEYEVLDAETGTLAFNEPTFPDRELRVVADVLSLAPFMQGEVNGTSREFAFPAPLIIEADRTRQVWLDGRLLSDNAERPAERVDGTVRAFTFESDRGLVVLDGTLQEEGRDYARNGPEIEFSSVPARNAQLRQYRDYWLSDPAAGAVLLAEPPAEGSRLWTTRYVYYLRPACGATVLECFFALPQHPVPFPHWIAERIGPFFERYPLGDERNVMRATLYTTMGTVSALLLGAALGVFLAVLFVIFRPLERTLLPWAIASQTVPIIALVPVLLLVLGNFGITIQTSLLPTALVGAYLCFFPVVVSTTKGLRAVEPLVLDLMRSYAASKLEVFWRVRLPAATPFLFTGLKLGMAAALVGALVAETESNNRRGLGYQILGQVQSGSVVDVWIRRIISAVLGIVLVGAVSLVQRILAPWERRA